EALAAARETGDDAAIERMQRDGLLPAASPARGGSFRMVGGVAVLPQGEEEPPPSPAVARVSAAPDTPPTDNVIADDLIVTGSACIGFDCVDGETFGFDTLRLKENNTRIHFEDTSSAPGFATHSWTLEANETASGGAEMFSIRDDDAATTPVRIEGGAPTNSLFVDSAGLVGIGTSAPALRLHLASSNTPAMRLEQTPGGGFGPYTWDVAANESNFFVRDLTAGNRLPLRIRPGAPTSSIDIASDGFVGIGTSAPSAPLHVSRGDGKAEVRVVENSLVNASRTLLTLRNNGPVVAKYVDSNSGTSWVIKQGNGAFVFSNAASGQQELKLNNDSSVEMGVASGNARFRLDPAGNLAITGALAQGSDRAAKSDVRPVNPDEVLAKVVDLPLSTWRYRTDDGGVRHMGPMAQDFAAAFRLGADDRHIALGDVGGVALAAVQALSHRLDARAEEVAALRRRNDELEDRNRALERRDADLERRLQALERESLRAPTSDRPGRTGEREG
ncbi:MAG: tail fiber domain-containing protein, partial [Alphaproteobacteria bacterium]